MKKTNRVGGTIFYLGVTFLALVFVAYQFLLYCKNENNIIMGIVFACIGLVVMSFLCYTLHEIGHLIGGKLAGFQLLSFKVGLLNFVRIDNKIKLKIKALKEYGGVCIMLPKNADNLYKKYARFVSGGLIASLVIFIMFSFVVSLPFYVDIFVGAYYAPLYFMFAMGFPVSVSILSMNAFPFVNNGVLTDGAELVGIRKKSPHVIAMVNIMVIQSYLMSGKSPAEMDEKLFSNFPESMDSGVTQTLIDSYCYAYYLDKGDYENVIKYEEKLFDTISTVPEVYVEVLMCDIFFTECVIKKRYDVALRCFEKIKNFIESEKDISTLRIKLAYELYLEGDLNKAKETAKEALDKKNLHAMKGVAKMEERLILNMLKEFKIETI